MIDILFYYCLTTYILVGLVSTYLVYKDGINLVTFIFWVLSPLTIFLCLYHIRKGYINEKNRERRYDL